MKTHLQRVRRLKFHAQAQEYYDSKTQISREHALAISSIFSGLVVVIVLGASIPGFYQWLDSTPPLFQILIHVIPLGAFAVWRLRKMLKP